MSVDTNFASLFDKLKVEDPWLPPSTWESIPSENGACPSSNSLNSSPPQPSLLNLSSVSEASIVRLALNAMQGLQSALVCIQKLSDAFCTDPADRSFHRIPSLWNRSSSTHALGKILNSIGCFGSLVFLLRKFVDTFMSMSMDMHASQYGHGNFHSTFECNCESDKQKEQHLPYSLVNQAFAVAVGKILEGYICGLNTVYASVGLRRSSKAVDVPLHEAYEETFLTGIVHSEVTLLEIYLHAKELRTQIEALGNICNLYDISLCFSVTSLEELTAKATVGFSNFYRGGDLLTYLYTQLQVADPAHLAILKFLFLRSCEPYCGFIKSWMFKAEISDPYKEFIVEYVDNLPLDGKDGIPFNFPLASIRDDVAVPCFLKDFLIPIMRAGQQLQVLMKVLEMCDYAGPGDHTYEDFLPNCGEYSSDYMFHTSPLTFSKTQLEALETARKNYYSKLQEKLGTLLTKLEFRYQQVARHNTSPCIFDNSEGGLKSEMSFTSNGGLIDPTYDKWDSNVAVDKIYPNYSSTRDESYCLDASEASECSSSSGSDGQSEAEQHSECPNSLVEHEQQYLSSLRFYMSNPVEKTLEKSIQRNSSHDIESGMPECMQKNNAFGQFVQSCSKEKTVHHMSVPQGSAVPNCCISDAQYADRFIDYRWSPGLLNSPFSDDHHYRYYQRLDQFNSALEVNKEDKDSVNKNLPYFRKMTSAIHVPLEDMGKDQFENALNALNSFILQISKFNHHKKNFSANPILKKNAFFYPMSKPEHKSKVYGHSLPCFDFSTVENPFKVSEEKLIASSGHGIGYQVPSADKFSNLGKQDNIGNSFWVSNARASCPFSPLDTEEQLREALVSTTVFGGRSWESLLDTSSYRQKESVGEKESLSAMFEIPLDFIIDKCLLQEILLQYKYVSKLAIKLLEGFDLHEHLLALRRYYFMELADWADLFIKSLWHCKWYALEADQRISEIQGFLEMSVQRSSCEQDPNKDRLFVYMKRNTTLPLSTSSIGVHSFDFLGLGYHVDWPVSTVLTQSALKIYADIFSFLIQVKLAVFSLTDVWCSLKDVMHFLGKRSHSAAHEREVDQFNMLIKMRHQLNHFISTLQQYVLSQLSHASWCRFLNSLKYKVKDMMDLELVHMEYLTDSLHICFLSDETRPVASIIESILQCALDFRSSLNTNMWDIELDKGDLLGRLSKINMSQVLAVKQKFSKNLKELHLCYLRSPKHGEFGLSCFWGYLNYEYYTHS